MAVYADSKEVEIARIVQNLLEVTNANRMQKMCQKSAIGSGAAISSHDQN